MRTRLTDAMPGRCDDERVRTCERLGPRGGPRRMTHYLLGLSEGAMRARCPQSAIRWTAEVLGEVGCIPCPAYMCSNY